MVTSLLSFPSRAQLILFGHQRYVPRLTERADCVSRMGRSEHPAFSVCCYVRVA
jgi:hypothetical protein